MHVLCLLLVLLPSESSLTFRTVYDVGLDLLIGNYSVAAFSDINSDKKVDLLLVNHTTGE